MGDVSTDALRDECFGVFEKGVESDVADVERLDMYI